MSEVKLPILHIGYGKTASTWFQKEFYPQVKDIDFYDLAQIREKLGSGWHQVTNIINTQEKILSKENPLVICDESMIGSGENIEKNALKFKEIFRRAQIIIFIRNQIDKFPSNYSEYIKAGGTLRFRDFVFHTNRKRFLEKHLYDEIISLYWKLFGKKNVYVYLYEDLQSNHYEFINKFCKNHSLFLKNEVSYIRKPNPRLCKILLEIKRVSNFLTRQYPNGIYPTVTKRYIIHIPFWFQITYRIFNSLNILFSNMLLKTRSDYYRQEDKQALIEYYAESNRALIARHGLSGIRNYMYPGCE